MLSIRGNSCIKLWRNKWSPEAVLNIKPFVNKYNWDETKYPSKIDDWKTFVKNNPTTALNVLSINKIETCQLTFQKLTQIEIV